MRARAPILDPPRRHRRRGAAQRPRRRPLLPELPGAPVARDVTRSRSITTSGSQSAHQKINCVECHASRMKTNLRRVATHIKGEVPDQVHLGADGISAMLPRLPQVSRAGVRAMVVERPFDDLRARVHRSRAQRQAAADRRLPALSRHAFRRRHRVAGRAREHGGALAIEETPSMPTAPRSRAWRAIRFTARARRWRSPQQRVAAREEIVRPSVGLFDRRTRVHVAAASLPFRHLRRFAPWCAPVRTSGRRSAISAMRRYRRCRPAVGTIGARWECTKD